MPTRTLELTYHSSCHSYQNSYFEKLCHLPNPVILESGQDGRGRWDILSADPIKVIAFDPEKTNQPTKDLVQAKLAEIANDIERYTSVDKDSNLPFISGAIGLINYSAGEAITGIKKPSSHKPTHPNKWPLIYTGIYQWAILQDHKARRSWLVADAKLTLNEWNNLCNKLKNMDESIYPSLKSRFTLKEPWQCSLEFEQYKSQFEQIQRYIHAGDCYQVNLTRCFKSEFSGNPATIYSRLAEDAPAPFSAYMEHSGNCVISRSPESFITVKNGEVKTRPIKGSRPTAKTPQQNIQNIESLSRSEKDRSENLMIVDLMRNDLGKLCKTGSVAVTRLFDIESYSNVHHMVSTITGKIKKRSPHASLELLGSCMPGGSVTGAPKKRAMEIIAASEPHNRSVYCGSLFYVNNNGDMNSNILIRSLLFEKKHPEDTEGDVYCWGGGAIVADSDLDLEFEESHYKVAHLLELLTKYKAVPN